MLKHNTHSFKVTRLNNDPKALRIFLCEIPLPTNTKLNKVKSLWVVSIQLTQQ